MLLYFYTVMMALMGFLLMSLRFGILNFAKPNVMQVMFWSHFLAQFIPATIIAQNSVSFAREPYLLSCAAVLMLIPIGGYIGDVLFPSKGHKAFINQPLADYVVIGKKYINFFMLLSITGALLLVIYVVLVPSFPLYNLISGTSDIASFQIERREAASLGLIFGVAQRFIMPLLFVLGILGASYLPSRNAKRWSVFAVIIAFLYNSWPGNKTPVATLFTVATFAVIFWRMRPVAVTDSIGKHRTNNYQKRKKKKPFRMQPFFLLSVAALYPVLIFMYKPAGKQGYGYIFESVFTRIFFKPAENTYAAFELYSIRPFTEFADIDKLANLFGWPIVHLSQEISIYRGFGEFTNSPPAAIGNFFAQGGIPVLMFGTLLAATIFKIVENMIYNAKYKSPVIIAFYALLLFGAFRFSWANFHTLLFTELFGPMAVAAILWSLIGRQETEYTYKKLHRKFAAYRK